MRVEMRYSTRSARYAADPSDEMDHRLAIEVAHALGPAAMLRAFTLDNLRWHVFPPPLYLW